jgi:hypothetical protein
VKAASLLYVDGPSGVCPVRAMLSPDQNTKKALQANLQSFHTIGLGGIEPPTPSPPDLYAKPLRYNPSNDGNHTTNWKGMSNSNDKKW